MSFCIWCNLTKFTIRFLFIPISDENLHLLSEASSMQAMAFWSQAIRSAMLSVYLSCSPDSGACTSTSNKYENSPSGYCSTKKCLDVKFNICLNLSHLASGGTTTAPSTFPTEMSWFGEPSEYIHISFSMNDKRYGEFILKRSSIRSFFIKSWKIPLWSKSSPKFWESSARLGCCSSFDEIRSKTSFLSLIKSGISRYCICFSKILIAVNCETFDCWAGRAKAGYKSPKKSKAWEVPEAPKARWASWEADFAPFGYVLLQNNERNTLSGCCRALMLVGLHILFLWYSNALISLLYLDNLTMTTSSISTMNVKQSNLSTSNT